MSGGPGLGSGRRGSTPRTRRCWPGPSWPGPAVQRALIGDWIDDPVTAAAKALFPDWVRWHAEQARLPERHFHHTLTTATANTHTIPDWDRTPDAPAAARSPLPAVITGAPTTRHDW
jgi:hypothetical protein